LSFGSARDIAKLIQTDMEKDVLAIDLSYVPFIDSSAAAALEEAIQRLKDTGDAVLLFGARADVIGMLRKTGVLQQLDEKYLLDSRIDALRLAQEIRAQRNGNQL
jgi:anti-anti-sigma regulatory factor